MQAAGRVPVAIAGTEGIDHVEIVATSGSDPIRRSATTLVQGELNSREGALWGMATERADLAHPARQREHHAPRLHRDRPRAHLPRRPLFRLQRLLADRAPQPLPAGGRRRVGLRPGALASARPRAGRHRARRPQGRRPEGAVPLRARLPGEPRQQGAGRPAERGRRRAADEGGLLPPAAPAGLPADLRHDGGGPRNPARRRRRRQPQGGLRQRLRDGSPAGALPQPICLGPPPRRLRRHEGRVPRPAARGAEARRCRRLGGLFAPEQTPDLDARPA